MPILHFRVDKQQQNIDLSRTLHSQNLTFRRAIITRNRSIASVPPAGTNPPDNYIPTYTVDYLGGIIIDVSFFKGFEILSNFTSNDLMVPFNNDQSNVDHRFDMNFASEDIALSFNVQIYDFKRQLIPDTLFTSTTGVADTAIGAIKYIDLFFEFDNLHDYNTY